MKTGNGKNQLIHKFLREELNEEELQAFRERWDADPEFVKEVQEYSRMTISLKAADRLATEKKMSRKQSMVRTLFIRYQGIAAVLLVAILLPLYLLLQGQRRAITPDSPEIIDFAKTKFINNRLNLPITNDNLAQLAQVAYSRGNIQEAITILQDEEKKRNIPSYSLMLADLFFHMNQPDSARYYYNVGLSNSPEDSSAQWNLLMSRILLCELIDVKKELETLTRSSSPTFKPMAAELLIKFE